MRISNRYSRKFCCLAVTALILAGFTANAVAEEETSPSEWNTYFEVYGWLPNIYITPAEGAPITLTLGDIIKNLDMLAMFDFGVQKDRLSFGMDVTYMNLGKKITRTGEQLPVEIEVDIDMRSFISTVNAGYRLGDDESSPVSVIGGMRYLYIRVPVEFNAANIGQSKEIIQSGQNWSAIFGLEGKKTFNDKWYMDYYADFGGGGKTNLTYQAKVGGGYQFNKFTATFGFRYLRWNFDSNSDLKNLRVIGPYVGAKWTF